MKASIEGAAAGQPTNEQVTASVPAIVVFGRDEAGKGHASWFAEADAALAERAAGMMGFKVLRLVTDEHRAAASGLPAGRVFASGKAFSPFVKEAACAARTSARLLASGCTALVLAGCSFKPGCANRDAKAAIEKDARSSVEFWLKSIGIPSLGSKAIFSLVATYETGRSGDTRSCSGSMSIKVGTDKVEVPITYEVIGTDEGSTTYRWDGGSFGKGLIAQALTGGLAGAIEKATEPPASSPTEATPPTEGDHADRTAAAMKRWRNGVSNISRR